MCTDIGNVVPSCHCILIDCLMRRLNSGTCRLMSTSTLMHMPFMTHFMSICKRPQSKYWKYPRVHQENFKSPSSTQEINLQNFSLYQS